MCYHGSGLLCQSIQQSAKSIISHASEECDSALIARLMRGDHQRNTVCDYRKIIWSM